MRQGRFQSWMMRNSPGSSKNGVMSSTITTSRSRKRAVPRRPYFCTRSSLKVVSLVQPRSGLPGGRSSGGIGRHSTSARTPSPRSVRHTKRKSPRRCRRTIA